MRISEIIRVNLPSNYHWTMAWVLILAALNPSYAGKNGRTPRELKVQKSENSEEFSFPIFSYPEAARIVVDAGVALRRNVQILMDGAGLDAFLLGRVVMRTASGREFPAKMDEGNEGYSAEESAAFNELDPNQIRQLQEVIRRARLGHVAFLQSLGVRDVLGLKYDRGNREAVLVLDVAHSAAHVDEWIGEQSDTRAWKNGEYGDPDPSEYQRYRYEMLEQALTQVGLRVGKMQDLAVGKTHELSIALKDGPLMVYLMRKPTGYHIQTVFNQNERTKSGMSGSPRSPGAQSSW